MSISTASFSDPKNAYDTGTALAAVSRAQAANRNGRLGKR